MSTNKIQRGRRASARQHGFTLLEILLAIFILSIVMSLVFGSFHGVFSSADKINATSDLYEMAGAGLSRISSDLTAIQIMQTPRYEFPQIDSDPDPYRVEGTTEYMGGRSYAMLRFTSLAHLPMGPGPRGGIARIVYYVQAAENGTYALHRSDTLYPFEEFKPSASDPIVCEQVRAFKVIYYDKEGRESEQWDSESDNFENSTPRTIGILLTLGSEDSAYDFSTEVALPVHRSISRRR